MFINLYITHNCESSILNFYGRDECLAYDVTKLKKICSQ
jgi:hypothetical protein